MLRSIHCLVALVLLVVTAAACGSRTSSTPSQFVSSTGAAQLPGTTATETVDVNGVLRQAIVYVPMSRRVGEVSPVILVLHGGGGSFNDQSQHFGFEVAAEKSGFLAVFPNGSQPANAPGFWWSNDQLGLWGETRPDDVGFIGKLLDVLVTKYTADPNRVFVTGASDGANMSYRLACALSGRIAAIAPVAAATDASACQLVRPVSVLHIHGTADPVIPYQGGSDIFGGPSPSVAEVIKSWQTLDSCPTEPATSMLNPVVEKQTYGPCSDGSEVTLYTVRGGYHCWPGMEGAGVDGPCPQGGPHMSFDATPLIVQFFFAHPRSDKPAT